MTRASYKTVDYSIRPAKAIVRKMIVETVRKLSPFGSLKDYRYVGFGSTYFGDFLAFHRAFGMHNMISIEREVGDAPRFEFNRPFGCIKIHLGPSTSVLPSLDWTPRTVLWLDYDDSLDGQVLADIEYYCSRCPRGSALIITLNARPLVTGEQIGRQEALAAIDAFSQKITRDKVPVGLRDTDLLGWKTADVYHKIIRSQIQQTLDARNGGIDPGSKMLYNQLFNFRYADGVKMLATGGVFHDEGQRPTMAACDLEPLHFLRHDSDAFRIE